MMDLCNTDLMKHPAARHIAPTEHEREARRARRTAFLAFLEDVFFQAPRHPDKLIEASTSLRSESAL